MNTLLRRRSMIAAGGGSPTPPAVMIPYIRIPADGYIDTGITPDNTTRIIVWARNLNPGGANYTYLFGSRIANGNSMFGVALMNNSNVGKLRVAYGSVNSDLQERWGLMSHYHKYELSADGFFVDDNLITTVTASTFSNAYNIFLGVCNGAGSNVGVKITPIDYCACKIYKNDVLVRDYTPVSSPSVGLYDSVSETLFTNAGSGTMTYGEFDENAYTPLDYIECNGSQYFDSGVKGTADVPVVSKFRITSTNKGGPALFGTYSSGTGSSYFKLQFGTDSNKNSRADFNINSETALRMYDSSSSPLTGRDVTFCKTGSSVTLYENNAQIGTQKTFSVSSSWETPYTFAVGTSKHLGGFASGISFEGRIYYFGIGANKNFVPCKNGDKVGMYDTYNDVFVESATSTPFTAGPQI